MRQELIATAMLLALVTPVPAAQYEYNAPSFKVSCYGKLELSGNSRALGLNTQAMPATYIATACMALIEDRLQLEQVIKVCHAGDICKIDGMIKPYSHDIFEWTRIDQVKKG